MSLPVVNTRGAVGELCVRRATDFTTARRDLEEAMQLRVQTADDGSGGFEGFLVVYGVEDSYGTTFQQGCFTRGGLDPSPYPYLAMHSPMLPLATFTAEEQQEGLFIAGEYDPTPTGQEWRQRALSGSAPELSVGFVWLDDGGEDDPDLITSARLVEGSQIVLRMASVPGATLSGVRGTVPPPDTPERRRAEALLALRLADIDL